MTKITDDPAVGSRVLEFPRRENFPDGGRLELRYTANGLAMCGYTGTERCRSLDFDP